jgi:hypothetical protein
MAPQPIPAEQRFWPKVDTRGEVPVDRPDLGPCWIWTAQRSTAGYGRFAQKWNRPVQAHRWSYEQAHGPIPSGLVIDHLCRNRACVNPAHMEPVPQRVNVLRGISFTAQQARQTHCKRGHKFTPENTHVSPKGERICRLCRKDANRRAEARRRLKWRQTPNGRVLRDAWLESHSAADYLPASEE